MLFVLLAYVQIKGTIFSPSTWVDQSEEAQVKNIKTQAIINQDTDSDGLLDFDEQYTYNTSIYLADTDSDGVTDKDEIDIGTDPLDAMSFLGVVKENQDKNEEDTIIDILPTEQDQLIQKITNQQIREFLIDSIGINKDVVKMFDDKTLINLYNEAKQETGIDLENINQAKPFSQGASEPSDLTIPELRQILINQGVDEQMLNKLDDNILETMFLQTLLTP